ncbi:acetyltransferase (GNAT) family protein [Paenibacillus taihuensis]|uniref:Acetyltransferase (GNAT) family protein n=1 Tax=Paenibacillus taihuensis TaxID=1156355 RepID=A0A3D9SS60_9BACL|nr:GNAT family N-acetyltransferase [Paenibacillus taihuensis]REE94551.1 acetyltransferase (GNAT) family protein [Paenibacillus taihuensis]
MTYYREMTAADVRLLRQIDRSEHIDLIYEMQNGQMTERSADHECPTWDVQLLTEMEQRFVEECHRGGFAIGAFIEGENAERFIGFGVLAAPFRGEQRDRLQVDLMYVSRDYRRQGIGSRIFEQLREEAIRRGAKGLYISSTETRSAVSFYRSSGAQLTDKPDEELLKKEPLDIHMVVELKGE